MRISFNDSRARLGFGMRAASTVAVCAALLSSAAREAQAQVRVPGFRPSVAGFAFSNSFAAVPHGTINVLGAQISITRPG